MPYITTPDGIDLHYHDWGHGEPVVLIHGWPLTSDMWEHQIAFLATNGYRVIAYDRRGFGKSSKPYGLEGYDVLADDLAAIVNQLDLTGATLVGMSMGGGEVVRYLSRHGASRISKAVLLSSVAPFMLKTDSNPDGTPIAKFDEMRENVKKDRFAFFQDFASQFYGRSVINHSVSQGVLDWTFSMAVQASTKSTYDGIGTFGETDMREEMKRLTTAFLVIHGTGDKVVPIEAAGRAAAKLLPNSTLIEYDGAPHGLLMTEPDRLNADLLNFLGGNKAPTVTLSQV
ncbi:MAG: alpha/beta fold hydrolase [Janthinobacterium lividum]